MHTKSGNIELTSFRKDSENLDEIKLMLEEFINQKKHQEDFISPMKNQHQQPRQISRSGSKLVVRADLNNMGGYGQVKTQSKVQFVSD